MPNRLTINRILSLVQTRKFCIFFTEMIQQIQKVSKDANVSLNRKSFFSNGDKCLLYMVSAWCNENSNILG